MELLNPLFRKPTFCRARTICPGERRLGKRTRIRVVPAGTGEDVAMSPPGLPVHNSTTAPGLTFRTAGACVDWSIGSNVGASGRLQDTISNIQRQKWYYIHVMSSHFMIVS